MQQNSQYVFAFQQEESLRRCKGDMEKMWAAIKQHAEELLSRRNVSIHIYLGNFQVGHSRFRRQRKREK
jgi:hypothetical protein